MFGQIIPPSQEPEPPFPTEKTRLATNQRRLVALIGTLDAIIREPSDDQETKIVQEAKAVLNKLALDYEARKKKEEHNELQRRVDALERELQFLYPKLLDSKRKSPVMPAWW